MGSGLGASSHNQNGARLSLIKPEDTRSQFRVQLNWLLAISATHFPPEHWNATGISAAFRKLGPVMEIDTDSISSDFTSVCVVVAMTDPDHIPPFLRIATKDGLGATFRIEVLRTMRRDEMTDADGFIRPFFPSNRRWPPSCRNLWLTVVVPLPDGHFG